MSDTQTMLAHRKAGKDLVTASGPQYTGRADGRWPVEYKPRNARDPQPWVALDSVFRYSGTEIEAIPPTCVRCGTVEGLAPHRDGLTGRTENLCRCCHHDSTN